MGDIKTCSQGCCENPSAFRYTWPGRDEAGICEKHSVQLRNVASAIGLYVQMIPLEDGGAGEEGSADD